MSLPSASDIHKMTRDHVDKAMKRVRLIVATCMGYTADDSMSIKFPEDAVASPAPYSVLLPYGSQKPLSGDKVLLAQIPMDDGSRSVCVLGEIGPPPGPSNQTRPTGEVTMFAGSSAPAGWLIANGQAVSRTTYADLFAVCGTTYGAGDGSTTFNVPNLNGSVPLGVGASSRPGTTTHTLGQVGGEETHQLSVAELALHSHTQSAHTHTGPSHSHTIPFSSTTVGVAADGANSVSVIGSGLSTGTDGSEATGSAGGGSTDSTGSSNSHNTLPPYLCLNFIVKT